MAYLGEEIRKLGFGLMRLPEKNGVIDIPRLKEMVDCFMAAGFTYFDTAYGYHGGRSEVAAREALIEHYPRESFQFATKLPLWSVKSSEDLAKIFNTSLEHHVE